jgi:hypothetical protein
VIVVRVLVGKHEGKRPLGRSSNRGEGNIKTDFKEIDVECVDWMYMAKNKK